MGGWYVLWVLGEMGKGSFHRWDEGFGLKGLSDSLAVLLELFGLGGFSLSIELFCFGWMGGWVGGWLLSC